MVASAQRYVCPDCGGRYRSFRTEAEWYQDHVAGICPVHFVAADDRVGSVGPVGPVVLPAAATPSAPVASARLRRSGRWVITREWYLYLMVGMAGVVAAKASGPGLLDVVFLLVGVVALVAAGYRLHERS